jgi:hypothetical protein
MIQELIKSRQRKQAEAAYARELAPKSPYEKYGAFVGAIVALTYLCQAGSAISSYSYFASIIGESVSHPVLTAVCVVAVILTFELLKRIFVNVAFTDFYTDKLHGSTGLNLSYFIAATIIAGSLYFSVVGGAKLINPDTAKTEAATVYDTEITEVRKEIADIMHRNTWKGSTWVKTSEQPILVGKEQKLQELREQKAAYEAQLRTEKQDKQSAMFYGFGLIDVLLVLLALFIYHYKYEVVQYAGAEAEAEGYAQFVPQSIPPFMPQARPQAIPQTEFSITEAEKQLLIAARQAAQAEQDKRRIGFHAARQAVQPEQGKNAAPARQEQEPEQGKARTDLRQEQEAAQEKAREAARQEGQRLVQGAVFGEHKPVRDIEGLRKAIAAGERERSGLTRFGVNINTINEEIAEYETKRVI